MKILVKKLFLLEILLKEKMAEPAKIKREPVQNYTILVLIDTLRVERLSAIHKKEEKNLGEQVCHLILWSSWMEYNSGSEKFSNDVLHATWLT